MVDAPGRFIRDALLPGSDVLEIPDPDFPDTGLYRVNLHDNSVTVIDYDTRGEPVVRGTRHPGTTLESSEDGSIVLQPIDSSGIESGPSVDSPHPPLPPEVQLSETAKAESSGDETPAKEEQKKPKKGKAASDSSKNEKHGDGGRAKSKADKQIEELLEILKSTISKREKKKLRVKIENIRQDAERKKKGTEHSVKQKR